MIRRIIAAIKRLIVIRPCVGTGPGQHDAGTDCARCNPFGFE